MKIVFIIPIFVFSFHSLFAQGNLIDEKKALIRNEQTFSLMLNSNGWGGSFTYGKMKNTFRKQWWNVELVSIKDPKEYRINHPSYPNKRRFVFGKTNEFFNLRLGYGHLFKLYDKKDKGGIEVRYFYHVGVLGGFLKPVYYVTQESPLVETKFNSSLVTPLDILGASSFFKGIDEISVIPGFYAKIGGSFEFSKKDLLVNALEGGLAFDVFPKKMELMANDQNQFVFISFFVNYRFGKVINPRAKLVNVANDKEDLE